MGEMIQSIVLSDVMMFFLVGVIMVLVTAWAHSRREYAGYLLGWLIGVLVIIIISVFSIGSTGDDLSAVAQVDIFRDPAVMMGLLFGSTLGVGMGFLLMSLARDEQTHSRVRRSLTIALATSITLVSGYLLIITTRPFRLVIAVLLLGLAIGALLSFVLGQQRTRSGVVVQQTTTTVPADEFEYDGDDLARPADPVLSAQDLPSPLGQRIHNLRQRVKRQTPW